MYFQFLELIIHYVAIIPKCVQWTKGDKEDFFFNNAFIKEVPGKGHPKIRIISLSAGANMSLVCNTDSSFLIVNLSDY